MFNTLPGFRDFYPEDCAVRNHLFRVWRRAALSFNFKECDGPILENLALFKEKSGDEIVAQLFAFADRGGREVALRPEMTPSLARMVAARAQAMKRPMKWFCIGEHFRYERRQKGRLRSFYQFNADIFAEAGPGADAEVIAALIHTLRMMGLRSDDFVVRISDRDLWILYLRSLGLGEKTILALLGLIDKRERMSRKAALERLRPIFQGSAEDFLFKVETLTRAREMKGLSTFFKAHVSGSELRDAVKKRLSSWAELLDRLEKMGLGDYFCIDMGVVRGLAYYTGFVFEAFDRRGEHRAIAGGGRYNHLVKKLGGPEMPAVGFAMGDVVIGDILSEKGLLPNRPQRPDLFFIMGKGEPAAAALGHLQDLRRAGLSVEYPLRPVAFGKQFKAAHESGAGLAVILGEDEVGKGVAKIKHLGSGEEEEIPLQDLVAKLSDHCSQGGVHK